MNHSWIRRCLAGAVGLSAVASTAVWLVAVHARRQDVAPSGEAVFTSTRYVTCLAAAPNGDLWAGTMGGIVRRTPDGRWRKYTIRDGLPSHEVRSITIEGSAVIAQFPIGSARLDGERWSASAGRQAQAAAGNQVRTTAGSQAQAAANSQARTRAGCQTQAAIGSLPGATCEATYRGKRYAATVTGLYVRSDRDWRDVGLPPSSGTHVSALLPHGEELLAAMFGDGIWAYDGTRWRPFANGKLTDNAQDINPMADAAGNITAMAEARGALPDTAQHLIKMAESRRLRDAAREIANRTDVRGALTGAAREITAMAEVRGALWIGTRRAGLWELPSSGQSCPAAGISITRPQTQPPGHIPALAPGRALPNLQRHPHTGPSGQSFALAAVAGRSERPAAGPADTGIKSAVTSWVQRLLPDEPIDHNCQAIAMFHGSLFVSTLENGLAVKTPKGWGHFGFPAISSNAPRQMVTFRDRLYVRHGNGKLDAYDGARWELNVGAALPHRQVSALAADVDRLYVAQWGGWSEFDGNGWAHHLNLPALQGVPITALASANGRLWIGTQNRGLAEVDRANGHVSWYDERMGMPDDWITALASNGRTITAGTFVGGAAEYAIDRSGTGAETRLAGDHPQKPWNLRPELGGENVTALEPDGAGGLFIATRKDVWRHEAGGALKRIRLPVRAGDAEAQCLCRSGGGLWIGSRTGLLFCAHPE